MICASCNEPMIVLELDQIEIDYCTFCQSIWLDSGELEALFENKEKSDQLIQSFTKNTHIRESYLKCPICRKKMEKVNAGPEESKVLIDRCKNDHGLWFDEGELHQILEHGDRDNKALKLLKEMFNNNLKS